MNNNGSEQQASTSNAGGPWSFTVSNPSPYERTDYVETDLESLGVDPHLGNSSLRLLRVYPDGQSAEIPFQIDNVLGADAPKRILTFMSTNTPAGPDDYSKVGARFRLEQGEPRDFDLDRSRQFLYVEHFHQDPVDDHGLLEWDQSRDVYGVKLHNDRLDVYFSLVAHPRVHTETDYAGAATSVTLKEAELGGEGEMLCPHGEWPSKLWGQLSELVFFPLPWEVKWFHRIPLIGERGTRYQLIASEV